MCSALRAVLKPETVYSVTIDRADPVIDATKLQETLTNVGSDDTIDSDRLRVLFFKHSSRKTTTLLNIHVFFHAVTRSL